MIHIFKRFIVEPAIIISGDACVPIKMKFDLDINEIGEPSSDDQEEDVAQGKDGAMIFFKVNPSIILIWREKKIKMRRQLHMLHIISFTKKKRKTQEFQG